MRIARSPDHYLAGASLAAAEALGPNRAPPLDAGLRAMQVHYGQNFRHTTNMKETPVESIPIDSVKFIMRPCGSAQQQMDIRLIKSAGPEE